MGTLHAWQANIVNTHAPMINVQNKANSIKWINSDHMHQEIPKRRDPNDCMGVLL